MDRPLWYMKIWHHTQWCSARVTANYYVSQLFVSETVPLDVLLCNCPGQCHVRICRKGEERGDGGVRDWKWVGWTKVKGRKVTGDWKGCVDAHAGRCVGAGFAICFTVHFVFRYWRWIYSAFQYKRHCVCVRRYMWVCVCVCVGMCVCSCECWCVTSTYIMAWWGADFTMSLCTYMFECMGK